MNIEKKLRRAFRRATPNVLGSLPAQDPAAKRRKHLPERAVRMIATAASFVILIGAATWGLLYFRDHFSGPIIHSGNTTPTTAPTQPTETVPPTDPQSPISREEALQIARTDAFGSITPAHTVAHAELQDEGSSAVYYIVLDDSARIYHYWIDGYSGAILQQQETAILYPVEAYERVMDAEPALAASLHTSVVRLYQDNNRYRYYVELQTDTEIHAFHVDALTGEIADRTVLSLETGIGWKGARDLAFAEKGATPETAEYWDIMLLSRDDAPMYRVCYKFDGYYYEATVGTDPDTATAQITHYEDIDFPQEPLPGNHVSWQEARDTLMDSLGLSMDSLSGFDIVDTDASVYSFTFQHEEDMHAYLVPAYDTSKMNGGILPQAHLPMTEIRLRDLALDSVGASLEELWYLETSQEEDQRLYYVSFRCGNRSYFCEVSQDNHISVNPRENPDTPPPGEGTADIVTWQTARDAALAAYGVQMQDIIDIDIGFSTAEARPIYTVSFQCGDESHTCTVDAQSGKVIDPNNPTPPEPQYPIVIDYDTADGIPVVSGLSGNNNGTNGFFWNKDRTMVIGIHNGIPEPVDVYNAVVTITHKNVEYILDFKWCSNAGEVDTYCDLRKESDIYVNPIVGNDQYVLVTVNPEDGEDYHYLLELDTMQVIDPRSFVKMDYAGEIRFSSFSSDLHFALIFFNMQHHLLDITTGAVTSIKDLTGLTWLTDYQGYSFVDNERICFMMIVEDEEVFMHYADCMVYNIVDDTMTTLYTDLMYGWLVDAGGVESHGRVHVHNHDRNSGVCIIDGVTGVHSLTGLPDVLQIDSCGLENVVIRTWSNQIYYLVEPDGTATPVFVKE